MLSIYVFSDGDIVTQVFNSVAAFMQTGGFSAVVSISAMFSVLVTAFQYIKTKDLVVFGKWFAIYFFSITVLTGVKTSVQIIDVTDPVNTQGAVDHVPYGIAMPAHIITSISYGLTQAFELVFHTVDDLNYTQTGMLYGAKLFNLSAQATQVQNAALKSEINDFVRQCIIPDIEVNHKYTEDQLKDSPNILSFIQQQSLSPLRGIMVEGQFKTCAEIYPQLIQALNNEASVQSTWLGRLLFGNNQAKQQEVMPSIESTYHYFFNMSEDAKNILIQNTMINAVREGIGTNFAENNAAAAMINYSNAAAMQRQLITDSTYARFSAYMLPLMNTMFFLILVGTFPIIIMLSMQPVLFFNVLKTYLFSMVILGVWPLMFCIINFAVTSKLSKTMSGIAIAMGGITLSNQNPLIHEAEQFSAYAGYMISLIPILSIGLFVGFDKVFTNASQTIMGATQSQVSQSASALAEGNLSMANTGIGNHSWNNVSANKHDTNFSNMHGFRTSQQANGSLITTDHQGHTIVNTSSGQSALATSLHAADRVVESLSQNASNSMQMASQHRVSADMHLNSAVSQFDHLNDVVASDTRIGSGISHSTSDSINQGFRTMHDALEQYNKGQSRSHQISLNEAVVGSWKSNDQVLTGIAGFLTGASGSGSVSASHNNAVSSSVQAFMNSSEGKSFSQSLDHVMTTVQTHHLDRSESHNLSQAEQTAVNFTKAYSAAQQSSVDLSQAHSYQKAASFAKDHSSSIDQNLTQPFVDWTTRQYGEKAASVLAGTDAASLVTQQQWATQYMNSNEGKGAVEATVNSVISGKADSITRGYDQQANALLNNQHVESTFDQNKINLDRHVKAQGLDPAMDTTIASKEAQWSQHYPGNLENTIQTQGHEVIEHFDTTKDHITHPLSIKDKQDQPVNWKSSLKNLDESH